MKILISNIKEYKQILCDENYKSLLSHTELLRAKNFSSQKRKDEFILGRILLRTYHPACSFVSEHSPYQDQNTSSRLFQTLFCYS